MGSDRAKLYHVHLRFNLCFTIIFSIWLAATPSAVLPVVIPIVLVFIGFIAIVAVCIARYSWYKGQQSSTPRAVATAANSSSSHRMVYNYSIRQGGTGAVPVATSANSSHHVLHVYGNQQEGMSCGWCRWTKWRWLDLWTSTVLCWRADWQRAQHSSTSISWRIRTQHGYCSYIASNLWSVCWQCIALYYIINYNNFTTLH